VVKRLIRALPVIILVSLFTLVLDHYGWLKSFETDALDRFFLLREKVPAQDVALVEIDDDDYLQLFHETSPLDPPTLADLIDAIAKDQPKLIAVDIDTSAAVFKNMKVSPSWPPIVWARGAHEAVADNDTLILEGVLGRSEPQTDLSSGIAIMPVDSDSKIRHFQREFLATNGSGASNSKLRVDSFHWAILRKYCVLTKTDERCRDLFSFQTNHEQRDNDLILNLAIDPYAFDARITASQVLDQAITGNVGGGTPVFLSIKDKIVLIGGNYAVSSDYHFTPSGVKSGADLTAIAVESELSRTGLRAASPVVLVTMEVLAGLALVVLNYIFPTGWKHLATLAAIPLLAFLGSWIAFASLALWANFVPTLVATQLHRLYEKLAEAKLLEREVQGLRKTLKTYEERLQEESVDPSNSSDTAGEALGNKIANEDRTINGP
jgi:CHASE2 domain-containing sensor protein